LISVVNQTTTAVRAMKTTIDQTDVRIESTIHTSLRMNSLH